MVHGLNSIGLLLLLLQNLFALSTNVQKTVHYEISLRDKRDIK